MIEESKPLVSIIVPIYKVEPYLRRCLDSIVNQTYTNLEIILVDDGSPDRCPAICDEYAAKDNRIVVIHKENGGLSDARNAGLNICKGDYVSFVDSDDWVEKDYISTLENLAKKNNADISVGNHQTFSIENHFFPTDVLEEGVFNNQYIINQIFTKRNQFKIAWGKLFKSHTLKKLKFPYGKKHEDEFVGFIPYFSAKLVVCTNQILYHYLKRSDSITGTDNSFDYVESREFQAKFLTANNRQDLANRTIATLCWTWLNKALLNYLSNDISTTNLFLKKFNEKFSNLNLAKKEIPHYIDLILIYHFPIIYLKLKKWQTYFSK